MATTPNYSWVMPDPTDFVTDLPADFEIFGDAVDATVDSIDDRVTDLEVITTEGDLIVGDASGDPVRVAVGTVGQVLASDGDTVEWVTPAAGGAFTTLASGSLSGSTLNLTSISGAYESLYLVLNGFAPVTNTGFVALRFNNDSGANRYIASIDALDTAFDAFNNTKIDLHNGVSNTATVQSCFILIEQYAISGTWKSLKCQTIMTNTASSNANVLMSQTIGAYNQTGAITEINLVPSGGFQTQGTYALYGVK